MGNENRLPNLNEWETEPDFNGIEGNGYHLVVLRHPTMRNLNGYVGVSRKHPWFGLHYDNHKVQNIYVHGGITFSGKRFWEGTKRKYWYFGFDTAHANDLVPHLEEMKKAFGLPSMDDMFKDAFGETSHYMPKSTYKNFEYVSNEVRVLFEQLKEVAERNPNYEHSFFKEYKRLHKKKMHEKRILDWSF